jgi:hypothetical protein
MNPIAYQLKEIDSLMGEMKALYAILGGVAVSVYGEPRFTYDIDVNVMLSKENVGAFIKAAKKHGFSPIPVNIGKFVEKTGVIPARFSKNGINGLSDFIIAQNMLELQAIKRARYRRFYSSRARVVRAEDLVLHKLLSERPRDREDARGIIRRQGSKLDSRYVNIWLRKVAKLTHRPYIARLLTEAKRMIRGNK